MLLNPRHTVVAGSVSGVLLLLTACASNSGSNPSTSSTPLTVTITGSTTVALGATSQYAAKVAGSSNQAVTWNVNQTAGGTAQLGTISTAGLYTAPATMPSSGTIVIAAVSAADSSISGVISVALQAPDWRRDFGNSDWTGDGQYRNACPILGRRCRRTEPVCHLGDQRRSWRQCNRRYHIFQRPIHSSVECPCRQRDRHHCDQRGHSSHLRQSGRNHSSPEPPSLSHRGGTFSRSNQLWSDRRQHRSCAADWPAGSVGRAIQPADHPLQANLTVVSVGVRQQIPLHAYRISSR